MVQVGEKNLDNRLVGIWQS